MDEQEVYQMIEWLQMKELIDFTKRPLDYLDEEVTEQSRNNRARAAALMDAYI